MKTELFSILIILVYSGLFFLANYFGGDGVNYLDLTLFTTGVTLGIALMYLDEAVFYQYYSGDDTESFKVGSSSKVLIGSRTAKINLITRSLLFMISLLPLGLFIVTSTGSELGIGLFLGIITILLLELVLYRKNINLFHSRFMFQLKRRLSIKEINIFVASFAGFTLIFNLLLFFLGR